MFYSGNKPVDWMEAILPTNFNVNLYDADFCRDYDSYRQAYTIEDLIDWHVEQISHRKSRIY